MEIAIAILAALVGVLVLLQGWQMLQSRRKRNNNPHNLDGISAKLGDIDKKLGDIGSQMGRMEQRLNDIWDKVKD